MAFDQAVYDEQLALKKKGYKIATDGIEGTQTQAARAADAANTQPPPSDHSAAPASQATSAVPPTASVAAPPPPVLSKEDQLKQDQGMAAAKKTIDEQTAKANAAHTQSLQDHNNALKSTLDSQGKMKAITFLKDTLAKFSDTDLQEPSTKAVILASYPDLKAEGAYDRMVASVGDWRQLKQVAAKMHQGDPIPDDIKKKADANGMPIQDYQNPLLGAAKGIWSVIRDAAIATGQASPNSQYGAIGKIGTQEQDQKKLDAEEKLKRDTLATQQKQFDTEAGIKAFGIMQDAYDKEKQRLSNEAIAAGKDATDIAVEKLKQAKKSAVGKALTDLAKFNYTAVHNAYVNQGYNPAKASELTKADYDSYKQLQAGNLEIDDPKAISVINVLTSVGNGGSKPTQPSAAAPVNPSQGKGKIVNVDGNPIRILDEKAFLKANPNLKWDTKTNSYITMGTPSG